MTRQETSRSAQSGLPGSGLLKGAWHRAPHSASLRAQQVDNEVMSQMGDLGPEKPCSG